MEKPNNGVSVISVGHETSEELKRAIEILNLSQSEFNISLIQDTGLENIKMEEIVKISKEVYEEDNEYYPSITNIDSKVFSDALYGTLEVFLKDLNVQDENVIYVINLYLYSDILANLFTNIQKKFSNTR